MQTFTNLKEIYLGKINLNNLSLTNFKFKKSPIISPIYLKKKVFYYNKYIILSNGTLKKH